MKAPRAFYPPDTRGLVAGLGLYALVGGFLSFLGWPADVPRLTDWFGRGISIQPNATVAVTVSGAALILLARGHRRMAAVLGLVVGLIGASTLLQYLSGTNFERLNTLLMFDRSWGRVGVVYPGRMGPPGSLCWTLVGSALIGACAPAGSRWRKVTSTLALTTAAITVLSITGYFYGVDRLYSLPYLTVIAFQTATFIAAVSLALIAAVPERAPMRWLIDEGGTGEVARRAGPFILLVPTVVGWLWLRGEQAALYDTRFGAAALVLLLIGLLLVLLAMNLSTIARHEEALREADRRKNEFLAILAHELRNPLAPISNVVQILRFVGGDAAAVRNSAETLDRQVTHMVRLVDDLLDVSRITRGTIELRRKRIDLQPLVAHSVETARTLGRERGYRFEVSMPREPIYLDADAARITQVIDNLLSNASKFSSPGGRIEVRVEQDAACAVLRVRDEGIGIAPDQLARIFEMFVQVDASFERAANGLGIGLTLVKNLVEMHGGTVTAHSEGLGHGTELVVRLPIAIGESKPEDADPTREESGVFRRDGLRPSGEARERIAP